MKIKSYSVILLLSVIAFALLYQTQAFASGINAVVATIAEYQYENGGFISSRDSEPTLEATEQALFLTSLFGNIQDINADSALSFVKSLHNQDGGYSNQPGKPSDIESVRNAILSFKHIGVDVENVESIGTFIDSLFDKDTKLYRGTFTDNGNVKSTALAYQTLSLLGLLETPAVKEKSAAIKATFSYLIKSDDKIKYFFSLTSDNYYALVVAQHVGLDLGEVFPWARYFLERQITQGPYAGGFFTDQEHTDVTPEDTTNAIAALAILQKLHPSSYTLQYVNVENLASYVSLLPRSLKAAYYGFTAFARLNVLQKTTFRVIPIYDYTPTLPRPSPPNHILIQGSTIRAAVSLRTYFGLPQPSAEVSLTILIEKTGEKFTEVLHYDVEQQLYYSPSLQYSASELGEVSFQYTLKWQVADLEEEVNLFIEDAKIVGYDLNVVAKAYFNDEEVRVGGYVAKGTQFEFEIKLGNVETPKPTLITGDFDVVFSVLDSSDAVIFRQVYDARKNTIPIRFNYELKSLDIPAGDLIFRFEVGDQKNGYHTGAAVSYTLPIAMVATNVQFSGATSGDVPTYEIGQKFEVTMQPGSLSETNSVEFYPSKDNQANPIRRKFVMKVSTTESEEGLLAVEGIHKIGTDGKLSYVFSVDVKPTFTSVGTKEVSFVYVTASGKHVLLKTFNLKSKFFEDAKLTYTVKTDLHVVSLKSELQSGTLAYGNDVKLSFQVKDDISKQLIYAENTAVNAFLVLKHKDGKKVITSTRQAANQLTEANKPSSLEINWSVNPNAIKGQGYIELVIVGADSKETTLLEENSKNAWKVDVDIGGSIVVNDQKYVNILDDEDAVFLLEFTLSCGGKQLSDAVLEADVLYGSQKVLSLPVVEGEGGVYSVSWTKAIESAPSGTYTVNIYRGVDLSRSVEGHQIDTLFSASLVNPGASTKFPIKLEVIALVGLGSAFFWLVFQKMEIEGTKTQKNKNKKKTK